MPIAEQEALEYIVGDVAELDPRFLEVLADPVAFLALGWPKARIYDKQAETLYSVRDNDETYVPAGNMLGKDYIAGYIALWFFLAHPIVRIVTTSIKDDHLRVLWGELGRWIDTCEYPLRVKDGGPLIVNHREIKKVVNGEIESISYLIGQVSELGEGMAGHHAPHTLCIGDEASGIRNIVYTQQATWAKKGLWIGNPNPCENFFKKNIEAGDKYSEDGTRCYQKIIRIRAEDSPNVRYARACIERGKPIPEIPFIQGVLEWNEYQKRRVTWDIVRQTVGLDGEFYKGGQILLYPPDALNRAEDFARLFANKTRVAEAMGLDTAEGRDSTVWTIIDKHGIIDQISLKTPDTSDVLPRTIALMRKYNLVGEQVCIDAGGGGKWVADPMRKLGYNVRTVPFGSPPSAEARESTAKDFAYRSQATKIEEVEQRYAYKNRRAEMYGMLSSLLDPIQYPGGFGIGLEYVELRRQLAPIPRKYDDKGTMYMLPKEKRTKDSKEETLRELLGCSPDEADSLVLAVFGMLNKVEVRYLGAY